MGAIRTTDGTEVSDKDFGEGISKLSSRSENGVHVALLWQRRDNTVLVVVDHPIGEAYVLDVHEHDDALDMFHHPYGYAAHRRIDHRWPAHGHGCRTVA